MSFFVIVLPYILISILIAYLGKNRKFGFWGFLFVSLIFTPLVGFLTFLASCENKDK